MARRRLVSSMAWAMESVIRSAYMCTWPETLRAARPMVWISDVDERRKPSLSASRMLTSETSGQVKAFAEQVDAHQDVEDAHPQFAEQFHPAEGVHVRVQVLHFDAVPQQVVGEVLGHPLGQGGDQDALVLLGAGPDLSRAGRRSGPWWA